MKATREALDAIDVARREGRVTERVAGPIAEAPPMLEDELLRRVLLLARANGWRSYHPRPGRTKDGWATPVQGDGRGFVDVVLARERVLWIELKREAGRQSPEQKDWQAALEAAGQEFYLWKPSDLSEIERILGETP